MAEGKRGAPYGNRNRARAPRYPGLRGQFYLRAREVATIDAYLASIGEPPSKAARLAVARTQMHLGIQQLRSCETGDASDTGGTAVSAG